MIDNKYYIYCHIRPDKNEIFYIGVGKEGTDRINHKRRNNIWENIVSKNNGNYIKEKLFSGLDLKEADQIEKYLIRYYGKIKDGGILSNILDGGHDNKDYHKMTGEEKEVLRKRLTGNKFASYKWSDEQRKRFSEVRTGKPNGKLGYKTSEETKKKQSNSHKSNLSNIDKISITNGDKFTFIDKELQIPEGWWKEAPKKGKRSQEFKDKCSLNKKGKKLNLSKEQIENRSKSHKGNKGSSGNFWINDGIKSKYIKSIEEIPEGWDKGRIRTWINQFKK